MLRIVSIALIVIISLSLHAAEGNKLVTDDFLKCAAHYAAWGYLLKSNGYSKKGDMCDRTV